MAVRITKLNNVEWRPPPGGPIEKVLMTPAQARTHGEDLILAAMRAEQGRADDRDMAEALRKIERGEVKRLVGN